MVFQNPNHVAEQQPKFTVNVFDDATNQPISCGSHDFTANSNLPGFEQLPGGQNIWFKPWSPVSINFLGYSGKTIRIEFATNDCAPGGHFGYAYVDVNENCSSPITGNTICPGITDHITLEAPAGFKEYYWYDSNFSRILGTSSTLVISPQPPVNTGYALRIVPFPELGCEDTLYTVINEFKGVLNLKVPAAPLIACSDVGVDLTDSVLIAGSTPKFRYTYHLDPAGTSFLAGAKAVKTSGTYYIKATNPSGCFLIKPVQVIIYDPPVLTIVNPAPVCQPATVNITLPSVLSSSTTGLVLSYWKDAAATVPLLSPGAIKESGVYYVKATGTTGCPAIKAITVTITDIPQLIISKPEYKLCAGEYLSEEVLTSGSSPGLIFSYWKDAACTVSIASLQNIAVNGTYFVKAVNSSGCVLVAPFKVSIYPEVELIMHPSVTVNYPEPADLNTAITAVSGLTYSFWLDSIATKPLLIPTAVTVNGTYYIKAENGNKCSKILPVTVVIIPPPLPLVKAPNAFTPNSDGLNDIFRMDMTGVINVLSFKVFDRWGQEIFDVKGSSQGWDGKKNGKDAPIGIYYWVFNGYDDYYKQKLNSSGSVALIR